MKKIKKIIKGIFYVLLIGFLLFVLFSFIFFDDNDKNILGYNAYIVLSDSMSKTDFKAGDVVVIKKIEPSTLKEGDIISYISKNKENYGEIVTHKIRKVTTNEKGENGFITYGTTTNTDDDTLVTYDNVQGIYKFKISNLGKFLQYLKTTPGYILCIFLPFLILLLLQGLSTIKIFRKYKKEELEEIEKEKEKIELERKEIADMLKEIKALKEESSKTTKRSVTKKKVTSKKTSPKTKKEEVKKVTRKKVNKV